MSIEGLSCIIPAGGEGSRLRPHTKTIPKPLLLMGNGSRRLIDFSINPAKECEVIVVTTSNKPEIAEPVEKYVSERLHDSNLHIFRDMTSGARSLVDRLGFFCDLDSKGSILILPADHVHEGIPFDTFYSFHQEQNADITLLTSKSKYYGSYVNQGVGEVKDIYFSNARGRRSITGIYLIKNSIFQKWLLDKKNEKEDIGFFEDFILPSVNRSRMLGFDIGNGAYWDDAGTHLRYHRNNMRISKGRNVVDPKSRIHENACLIRTVVLGNAKLKEDDCFDNAIISSSGTNLVCTNISK